MSTDRKQIKKMVAGLSDEDRIALTEELGIKENSSDKDIIETIAGLQKRLEVLEAGNKKSDDKIIEEPKKEKSGLAGLFDIFGGK